MVRDDTSSPARTVDWRELRHMVEAEATQRGGARSGRLDVEDVTQEALLILLQGAPPTVRERPRMARAYVRTVVGRLTRRPPTRLRSEARRSLPEPGDLDGDLRSVDFEIDLYACLRRLRPRDRRIVADYLLRDHDTRTIATRYGLSRRRVQMVLHDRLPILGRSLL